MGDSWSHLPPLSAGWASGAVKPQLQMLRQKVRWPLSFQRPWQGRGQHHRFLYKHLELQFQISLLSRARGRLLVLRDLELLIVSEARELAQTQSYSFAEPLSGGVSHKMGPKVPVSLSFCCTRLLQLLFNWRSLLAAQRLQRCAKTSQGASAACGGCVKRASALHTASAPGCTQLGTTPRGV